MRSFCFLFLASALSVSSSGKLVAPKPELQYSSHVNTQRAVIGSVADITSKYENGTLVTVVHILESRTDLFPREPALLQVLLCGNQASSLSLVVHTNITLVYNRASQSRLSGCLNLISIDPWQNHSNWQAVTFTSGKAKRLSHIGQPTGSVESDYH